MTTPDVRSRWESRRVEWARLHVQVDGAALAEEVLADLDNVLDGADPVTLGEAAAKTGYSTDHLSRLIRSGKLVNHGQKHAPRVKLSECPRKPARKLADGTGDAYDPAADARSLVRTRR